MLAVEKQTPCIYSPPLNIYSLVKSLSRNPNLTAAPQTLIPITKIKAKIIRNQINYSPK